MTADMQALVLHGPDDLRVCRLPVPRPGPGEVVLAVEAALTCATDAKMLARGHHPALPPTPCAFGHECAGTVAARGAGVTHVHEGDEVAVVNSAPCGRCRPCRRGGGGQCLDLTYLSGAYAQFVRVPAAIVARNLLPRPAGMPPELAAMVEPVACGLRGVARSRAAADDVVVVLGGGVQGQTITAGLTARGCRVVMCDPHEPRRALALRMGAEAALPAPRDDDALAAVLGCTPDGAGADVVFAAVGAPEAWSHALLLAGPGGEVNFHGGPPPGSTLHIPASDLHYRELTLQASYHHDPAAVRAALHLLAGMTLPFHALLGTRIGLSEVAGVLRAGGDKRVVDPGA